MDKSRLQDIKRDLEIIRAKVNLYEAQFAQLRKEIYPHVENLPATAPHYNRLQAEVVVDENTHIVWYENIRLILPPKGFQLVKHFVANPKRIYTRQNLLDLMEVPGSYNDVYERTVDSHIKKIRKAFRHVNPEFPYLTTVYGIGYIWDR